MKYENFTLPIPDPFMREGEPAATFNDDGYGFQYSAMVDRVHQTGLAHHPRSCDYVLISVPLGQGQAIADEINQRGKS